MQPAMPVAPVQQRPVGTARCRRHRVGQVTTDPNLPVVAVSAEANEVLEVIGKNRLHIVHAGCGSRPPQVLSQQAESNGSLQICKVPLDAPAIVVLVDASPGGDAAAKNVVRNFTMLVDAPPIIAVLLREPQGVKHDETATANSAVQEGAAAADAKKALPDESEPAPERSFCPANAAALISISLLELGADDVFMQPTVKSDLPTSLAISLVKAERHYQQIMSYEEQIGAHLESHNRLFWRSVHLIFNGFAPLDSIVGEAAGKVGERAFVKQLGKGANGQVFCSVNETTKQKEAVKVVAKKDIRELKGVGAIWRECRALRKLEHPNIVSFHEMIHAQHHLYICMELAGPHNLATQIAASGGLLEVLRSQAIYSQLAAAVGYAHKLGIAHRDIKPENIAIDAKDTVKLLDWGLAVEYRTKPEGYSETCGTMPFVSPEALLGLRHNPATADVWSMGVVLLELLFGMNKLRRVLEWKASKATPEMGQQLCDHFKDTKAVVDGLVREALANEEGVLRQRCPEAMSELLVGVLTPFPEHRWSIDDVIASPWLAALPTADRSE